MRKVHPHSIFGGSVDCLYQVLVIYSSTMRMLELDWFITVLNVLLRIISNYVNVKMTSLLALISVVHQETLVTSIRNVAVMEFICRLGLKHFVV